MSWRETRWFLARERSRRRSLRPFEFSFSDRRKRGMEDAALVRSLRGARHSYLAAVIPSRRITPRPTPRRPIRTKLRTNTWQPTPPSRTRTAFTITGHRVSPPAPLQWGHEPKPLPPEPSRTLTDVPWQSLLSEPVPRLIRSRFWDHGIETRDFEVSARSDDFSKSRSGIQGKSRGDRSKSVCGSSREVQKSRHSPSSVEDLWGAEQKPPNQRPSLILRVALIEWVRRNHRATI